MVQCSVNVQNILEIFKTIWTSPKYYATSKRMPLKTHLAQWPRVILNSNLSFLQIKLHTKNLELLDKIYKKHWRLSYSILFLKFIHSEKTTKFCEIFTLLLFYVVPVKIKMKISQNLVAFSEYMNFIMIRRIWSGDFRKKTFEGSKFWND